MRHLLLTGRAPGGLGTWYWCPLPPLPRRAWTMPRAVPQLVIGWDCTSLCGDIVTGTFAFLYQKRTSLCWMFWRRFSQLIHILLDDHRLLSTRLTFQGEVPPSVMLEGGCGASNNSCCVFRLKYTPRPRRNAGEWWPQTECGVNVVARRRISDLFSWFTCLCVACFKFARPRHGSQVCEFDTFGEGVGTGGEIEERGIWVGGFGWLNETLVLLATPSKRKWWPCSRLDQALP